MTRPLQTALLGALGAAGILLLAARRDEAGTAPLKPLPFEPLPPYFDAPWWDQYFPTWEEPVSPLDPTAPAGLPSAHPNDRGQWDNQIRYASGLYGFPDPEGPLLFKAVITHESGFLESAKGDRTGAPAYRGDASYTGYCSLGLMQVNRCAHASLALRYDLRDGNQNILAGGELLLREVNLYWPDLERILIGYNGPAVAARGAPYSNQRYADSVLAWYGRLGGVV